MDRKTSPQTTITDQRVDAPEPTQDAYGVAVVSQSAAELLDALNMESEIRGRFLGRIATKIENLNPLQRRNLAGCLQQIVAILEVEPESHDVSPGLAVENLDLSEELPSGNGLAENPQAGENVDDDPQPMTGPQRTWLERLYSEDVVAGIAELPLSQRLSLARALCEHYKQLSIARINSRDKQRRSEQLLAFMGGSSFREIAEESGSTYANTVQGINTMAKSIVMRTSEQELKEMLDGVISTQEVPSDEPAARAPERQAAAEETMPREQGNWYKRLFLDSDTGEIDETSLEIVGSLDPGQIEQLIEMLARLLRSFDEKLSPTVRDRREAQMIAFMRGETTEQIAAQHSTNQAKVKQELHAIVSKINRNIPQVNLRYLVGRAKAYQAGEE